MVRGERLIGLGDSWFSAKTIEVVRSHRAGLRFKPQTEGKIKMEGVVPSPCYIGKEPCGRLAVKNMTMFMVRVVDG